MNTEIELDEKLYLKLKDIDDNVDKFINCPLSNIEPLYNMKLVRRQTFVDTDRQSKVKWLLSDGGRIALEKYEKSIREETREIESLTIAKESNKIAQEANERSSKSNHIAIGALVVSILAIIASVIVGVLCH